MSGVEQLEQVMLREQQQVEALAAILEQEQQLLSCRQAEGLTELVAAKEKQMLELEHLAQERASLLRQQGYANDKHGLHALFDTELSGKLRNLWQSLDSKLRQCRYQNEVNGKLLEIGKQQTRQLLSLLMGQVDGGTEIYDQTGTASTSYGKNPSLKV